MANEGARPRGGPGSIFVIDANNIFGRAFHGYPERLSSAGVQVGAVFGYIKMICALRRDYQPESVVACFDSPGKGWRHDLLPEYKAKRSARHDAAERAAQLSLAREATTAMSVQWIDNPGYEADDLIGHFVGACIAQGKQTCIVSGDKDLMQLILDEQSPGGPTVTQWDGQKAHLFDRASVIEKFGLPPESIADMLALAGDTSDDVPGVPGIGKVTAAELIRAYGDLEGVLAAAPGLKQAKRRDSLIEHAETARLCKKLVVLDTSFPQGFDLEPYRDPGIDPERMRVYATKIG